MGTGETGCRQGKIVGMVTLAVLALYDLACDELGFALRNVRDIGNVFGAAGRTVKDVFIG